jgi:SAM-dependent methyltransferase
MSKSHKISQQNNSEIWNSLYTNFEQGKPLGISYPTEALVIFLSNLRKTRNIQNYFDDSGKEHSVKTGFSGRALEIGFGSLANIRMMYQKGFSIDGIEVSLEAVDRGVMDLKNNPIHSSAQEQPIRLHHWNPEQQLPFSDGTFDLIVGLQCIYYNLELSNFLNDVYRVMKQGASFCFSFFSRKHSYMQFIDLVDGDIAMFNDSHPNARLRGATLVLPPTKEDLEKYFSDFIDVSIFTTESDQTPLFESWWYVTGRK